VQLALAQFGREQLARRLGVPPHWIDHWAQGVLSVPDRKVELLIDLLGDARQKRAKS
jgi:DNA-binding transcriptional regulator YdaS (Cro superfamily)